MWNAIRSAITNAPPFRGIRAAVIERVLMQMRGEISSREARFLLDIVQNLDDDRPIVEIGTLFGYSTGILALGKKNEQLLVTVDNFSWNPFGLSPAAHERITRYRLRDSERESNVRIVRASKDEFFAHYDLGPPALVFLDADHSYEATRQDILWAQTVGAGVICGHDYTPGTHDGVVQAVNDTGGPRLLCESLFVLK